MSILSLLGLDCRAENCWVVLKRSFNRCFLKLERIIDYP